MRKLQELKELSEKSWKKWFRRDNLIVMVLAGILLFIIALPTKDPAERSRSGTPDMQGTSSLRGTATDRQSTTSLRGTADQQSTTNLRGTATDRQNMTNLQGTSASTPETGLTWQDYADAQEKKLERILSAMDGVGKVEVMLTVISSEELVVEKETPIVRSNTNEEDSDGGTRIVTQLDKGDTTVYRTAGSDKEPYVVKVLVPRVEGVLVVAEGAGSGTVNKDISEIARALFGVEAHKVKVVRMEAATGEKEQ